MRKTYYAALLVLTVPFFTQQLHAQVAAKLDINNISAAILTHGDMWWNPATKLSSCEFYKGTGISISSGGSLWMSGIDGATQLHVAAQTYRQKGNDYWPGPLDTSGTLTSAISNEWDKIWKIDYAQIDSFKSVGTHTLTNTPTAILEWPAKGNSYAKGATGASLSISQDMAPFVDVNGNGTYEPLSGDYPLLKGDQMLWWVFSDNGPTHDETGALPLKVEVHASAYAYNRPGILKNIQYYEYDVINKGATYNNFRMGLWADMDLGYSFDDYIGFDSARRMGYIYNSETPDHDPTTSYGYGSSMPIAGISVIQMPNDGTSLMPVGSFMYYNNDFSAYGNPGNGMEYYYYLNSTFRGGQHLHNDFAGYGINSSGTGPGANVNYVFPGDPANTSQWSECSSQNIGGDRRFIISTSEYTFPANQSAKFIFALVVTDTSSDNYCPHADITKLKQIADSSWYYFNNPSSPTSVANITTNTKLEIYPNPTHNTLNIKSSASTAIDMQSIQVLDILGRSMTIAVSKSASGISIDVNKLVAGTYTLICHDASGIRTELFVKQ